MNPVADAGRGREAYPSDGTGREHSGPTDRKAVQLPSPPDTGPL